ncbi:DUF2460 domain-containing protein [Luteimonas yindakuii]|uniref:DUF2460 domain-containing protein n=1 Tax=Luteimonas yindakuii TaxID=2565782 RepID=UPI00140E8367|nr:DUF2460 domain-containing protein [Luteimonas yindakuii]
MTTKMMVFCGTMVCALMVAATGCGPQEESVPGAAAPAMPDAAPIVEPRATPIDVPAPLNVAIDDVPAGGYCSLDVINGQPASGASVTVGNEARFGGWVGDADGQVPGDVQLVMAGASVVYGIPLKMDVDRPDVAQALEMPGLARSGFGLSTVLDVEPGTYRLSALIGSPTIANCAFNAELTVAAR